MPVHAGRSGGTMSKCIDRSFVLLLALALCVPAFADVPVPAPGASPRIDAIKKAGVYRHCGWLVTIIGEAAQRVKPRASLCCSPIPGARRGRVDPHVRTANTQLRVIE